MSSWRGAGAPPGGVVAGRGEPGARPGRPPDRAAGVDPPRVARVPDLDTGSGVQRGRSAERGSERMLCAPCAAQSRVSRAAARARPGPWAPRPRRTPVRVPDRAEWAATRPPRSFGGHLFRPWTFQLYVGVEGGGCTGAGDRRAPDSDAAHTDGAASTTNAPFLCHISTSHPTKQLAW